MQERHYLIIHDPVVCTVRQGAVPVTPQVAKHCHTHTQLQAHHFATPGHKGQALRKCLSTQLRMACMQELCMYRKTARLVHILSRGQQPLNSKSKAAHLSSIQSFS